MGGFVTRQGTATTSSTIISTPQKYSIGMSSSSNGSQIEVDVLFSALLKLSCVFEVEESLITSLTDEIIAPEHTTFNDQFVAVQEWIKNHCAGAIVELTAEEIDFLIQYVELYFDENFENPDTLLTGTKSPGGRRCPLMCPYRSDLPALTAEIRRQEAKRASLCWHFPEDNTVNLRFSESHNFSYSGSHSLSDTEPSRFSNPQSRRFSDFHRSSKSFSECNSICNAEDDIGVLGPRALNNLDSTVASKCEKVDI